MANIRRGLKRIGNVLMVWGITISIISISAAIFEQTDKAALVVLLEGGIAAWAPFLLFKFLFWIGSGFVDDE